MIALFDEPLRISIKSSSLGGIAALLLGLQVGNTFDGVVCLEDGSITLLPATDFLIDWRYHVETDQWLYVGAPEPGQSDQEG